MRFAMQTSSFYFSTLKKEGQPAYDSLPLSHRHVYNHACWHVCIEPKDFPLLFFTFKPTLTAPYSFFIYCYLNPLLLWHQILPVQHLPAYAS